MAKPSCAQQELLLLCNKVFVFLFPKVNSFEDRMQIFGGGCLLLNNFHPAGKGHDILESFALPRRRILAHLQYHISCRKLYLDYADGILRRIREFDFKLRWLLGYWWLPVFGFCAPIGKRNIKKGGLFFPMFSAPIGTRNLKTKTKTPFLIFDF